MLCVSSRSYCFGEMCLNLHVDLLHSALRKSLHIGLCPNCVGRSGAIPLRMAWSLRRGGRYPLDLKSSSSSREQWRNLQWPRWHVRFWKSWQKTMASCNESEEEGEAVAVVEVWGEGEDG